MTEPKLMNRAALARLVSVDEDVLVFWIRQGLLVSSESEGRKHRRFDLREAKVALILRAMRDYGMNVGAMRELVDLLRTAFAKFDALPKGAALFDALAYVEDVESGVSGLPAPEGYFHAYEKSHPEFWTPERAEATVQAVKMLTAGDRKAVSLSDSVLVNPDVLVISRSADGMLEVEAALPQDSRAMKNASALLLNLRQLFSGLSD